ncbi:MAG: hypothetical protein OES57_08840, partial [Acidimicrobiia bacterium]|nr:hypothetical protein [Acidimicrobiia bacterium]
MSAPTTEESTTSIDQGWSERSTSDRASIVVFGLALVVGFVALVADLGRYYWFNGDEWFFLVDRDGGDLGQLFEPHNEHLNTLPILVWRAMFRLFGLESYLPYQIPVLIAHLTVVACLWLIIRRCQVNPWIATAAASVLILFGPGEENIIWAFQIGFTGSLALGLVHLLLADHRGPINWRDWAGLTAGLAGLLSSGFAPLITAVIGAVVLVRRGWRPALFNTVPLAVIFVTWWLAIGPDVISDPYDRTPGVGDIAQFVWTAGRATFEGLGGSSWLAIVYVVVLVVGLVVAYAPLPRAVAINRAVLPVGLLVAGVFFLVVSGYGRWWIGPGAGAQSRYIHLAAAFTLPALAVAIDALARRSTVAVVVAVVVLASVIPHNIGDFENHEVFDEQFFNSRRRFVVSLTESSLAREVPPETRPDPLWSPVPIGWLLDLREDGRLPSVESRPNPADPLLFGLSVLRSPNPYDDCLVVTEPIDLQLRRGDELGMAVGPWTEPKDGWFFNQAFSVQLLE